MKNYEKPMLSITQFDMEDVITTSNITGRYNPNNLNLSTLLDETNNSINY
jgi:hypothetical protein